MYCRHVISLKCGSWAINRLSTHHFRRVFLSLFLSWSLPITFISFVHTLFHFTKSHSIRIGDRRIYRSKFNSFIITCDHVKSNNIFHLFHLSHLFLLATRLPGIGGSAIKVDQNLLLHIFIYAQFKTTDTHRERERDTVSVERRKKNTQKLKKREMCVFVKQITQSMTNNNSNVGKYNIMRTTLSVVC